MPEIRMLEAPKQCRMESSWIGIWPLRDLNGCSEQEEFGIFFVV